MDKVTFQTALYLFLLNKTLETGEIGWEDGKEIIQTLHDNYSRLDQHSPSLVVLRKMGVVTVLLVSSTGEFFVDDKTKVAVLINIENVIDELLNKLMIGGF
ncbi:DUF4004 family protein [Evansella sp. AB-P1]|nr:DUF4004 family protein [Evansella sp. AB-P1]MDG5786159.1 DUF4004 family protein [Evansella sp. AB-P1]